MKVNLLHAATGGRYPSLVLGAEVAEDVGLAAVYAAMAAGDEFLFGVAKSVISHGLTDPDAIRYRQAVLADCIQHPDMVRRLYAIAADGTGVRRWTSARGREPRAKLRFALEPLAQLIAQLRALRETAQAAAASGGFGSAGFRDLFAMLAAQLDEPYLASLERHIASLDVDGGVQMSARLGLGHKAADFVLHQQQAASRKRGFGLRSRPGKTFTAINELHAGQDDLTAFAGKGLKVAADVVSEATDHVQEFFRALRTELGFYLGGLNLWELLGCRGFATCFPVALPVGQSSLCCRELRDVSLCVTSNVEVVGNDVDAENTSLIVVTGANNGGKSTFLRSVGIAQLMMQAGMFVAATAFECDVRLGVLSHFPQNEDRTMTSGRLEEELARMDGITKQLRPNYLLLANEPFASTNERDAALIARPIVEAVVDAGGKVVFVTHLYDFAHGRYAQQRPTDRFLRAERRTDGARTFKLVTAPPEPTSHGEDIYRAVFG